MLEEGKTVKREIDEGRLLGSGAFHGQVSALLFGRDKPGDERADQAEDWGQTGCPDILVFPHECQGRWEDGGGDYDTHEKVEVAHGYPDI